MPNSEQTSESPKGVPFSLHTAGTMIKSMFPRFPVIKNHNPKFGYLRSFYSSRTVVLYKLSYLLNRLQGLGPLDVEAV